MGSRKPATIISFSMAVVHLWTFWWRCVQTGTWGWEKSSCWCNIVESEIRDTRHKSLRESEAIASWSYSFASPTYTHTVQCRPCLQKHPSTTLPFNYYYGPCYSYILPLRFLFKRAWISLRPSAGGCSELGRPTPNVTFLIYSTWKHVWIPTVIYHHHFLA